MKLSKAQSDVLRSAFERGNKTSSGRYGWSRSTLVAMQKKGLVEMVSESTWDAQWRLTPTGVSVAKDLFGQEK